MQWHSITARCSPITTNRKILQWNLHVLRKKYLFNKDVLGSEWTLLFQNYLWESDFSRFSGIFSTEQKGYPK